MALQLLIILLFVPVIFLVLHLKHTKTKISHLPPGPRGLPLIGNLHQFDTSNPQLVRKLSLKYGSLMSLRLGFVPTLVVSSAKMAKEVMKTNDLVFCSRPALHSQQKLSYNGLDVVFSPYDAYWREIRKICVIHLFNSSRVQDFRPIREDEISRMIEKISKSAVASKPVNLSELMMSVTSTITCRLGFGKRYEDEGSDRSRFHSLLHETQALFVSFFFSDYFPSVGWIDKLRGMVRRLEKNFQEFDAFYQELIEEHLDPKKPKNEQEDIIDILLQIRKDRRFKVEITWDHIKAVLMVLHIYMLFKSNFPKLFNFILSSEKGYYSSYHLVFLFSLQNVFVAGTDTSAATVIWAMTFLMKYRRVMKKVQEEIRHEIGNKGFVDEDDLQKLAYLKAVVKETMRLQPTVPFLVPRETTEKCTIEGYEIPAKTLVFVNAWAIGRDPETWKNPDEFYPERFIGSSIDFKGQHFELIPFGAGRRICPGLYMGIATVDLALANLLYKFNWEIPSGMEELDFDVLPGITMHKKNLLRLMARNHV